MCRCVERERERGRKEEEKGRRERGEGEEGERRRGGGREERGKLRHAMEVAGRHIGRLTCSPLFPSVLQVLLSLHVHFVCGLGEEEVIHLSCT